MQSDLHVVLFPWWIQTSKITRSEIINVCNYKLEDKFDNEELDYTRDIESTKHIYVLTAKPLYL